MIEILRGHIATAAVICMAAFASSAPATASSEGLTGTVSYRERLALPPNAVVDVRLIEAPAAGGKKETIAQTRVQSGAQVPIPYRLEFAKERIKSDRSYALQAVISVDGRPWFFSSTLYPAPAGQAGVADIVVQRITTAADSGGKDAVFGRWTVETIRDGRVAPDIQSSLDIGSEGKITGQGGCNSFQGDGKINGDQLTFGEMTRTLKACPQPVMAQEEKYLDAIADVKGWRVNATSGKLELLDGNGKVIIVLARS